MFPFCSKANQRFCKQVVALIKRTHRADSKRFLLCRPRNRLGAARNPSCLGRHAWLRRIQLRMSPPIESSSTVRAQPSLGASRCAACTPFAFPPASRCAARCQPCQCGPKPIARARSRPRGPEHLLARTAQDAPVAQLDRAPDYESGGQEFESLRARQQNQVRSGHMGYGLFRRHG